jgi:hypothetical protein
MGAVVGWIVSGWWQTWVCFNILWYEHGIKSTQNVGIDADAHVRMGSSRKELCRSWLQHPPLASIAVTLPVMTVSESLGLLHLVERRTSLAAHRHHRFNEQITRFPAEHNLFPPPVTRSKYTRKFDDWISPSQHHFFAYLSCWNLPLVPCHEILSSLHALLLENWKNNVDHSIYSVWMPTFITFRSSQSSTDL